MYPPFYETLFADSAVTAEVGNRIFSAGQAAQNTELPYVTWQIISGAPENYVNEKPDTDLFSVQVDVYSRSAKKAREIGAAVRDAIEEKCHITGWRGEDVDAKSQIHHLGFDCDWWVAR